MSQNYIRYLTPINIEIKKDKYCRFKKSGIKFIDYKDATFLLRLVNEQGKILPRRITGTSAKKAHEDMMKQRSHKESKVVAEAEAIAAKLAETVVTIGTKVGENGKIFGSVNTVQLSKALKKAGFDIDRKALKIKAEPIKEVGTYEAEANLHKGVKPMFKFEVVGE